MTDRINECPFCGGEVDVEEHTRFGREKMYYVECRNNECATMPSTEFCHSKEEAIKRWNTRKPMDRIVERLEERTEFLKDCTKYGNKDAEQQNHSYSTMLMYEVADMVDDLIEIVKEGGKDGKNL